MSRQTIRVENVHYAYPSAIHEMPEVPVLQGIDLEVAAGEFLAIMGPTGAGKTTLCLTLNGLVPQSTGGKFRGDVWVAGHNTKRSPVTELATEVGLVFQDSESQLFNMTVEDEVAFGPESLGFSIAEIERRIQWVLDVVGLAELRGRSPYHLSGGQQRRLAVASVLSMKPAILVLDEPTTGLDPVGRRAVLDVIAELRRQGSTVIMATQDADAVASIADRVIVLEAGHIVMQGTAQQVLEQVEKLNALGTSAPTMAELSHRLGIQPTCLTVDQAFQALSQAMSQKRAQRQAPANLRSKVRPKETGQSHCRPGSQKSSELNPEADDKRKPVTRPSGSRAGQPVLSFESVWYQYEAGVQALAGVDLDISSGEYVALIGANGSGKTTLARHMNGLLHPQQGRVLALGHDTQRKMTGELARWISYVFQNPDHQIFAASVREEIAFGPRNLGLDQGEIEQRVQTALSTFELSALADLPPATLGYGQRRLVTLASVHAMQPQIVILDEPAVGLDRHLTTRMIDWLSELHHAGATVVLITHNMWLASIATRCVVMNRGRVILDGEPAQVFQHSGRLAQAGIVPSPFVELGRRLNLSEITLNIDGFCQTYARFAGEESAA